MNSIVYICLIISICYSINLNGQEAIRLELVDGSEIEGSIISDGDDVIVLKYRGNEIKINKTQIKSYSSNTQLYLDNSLLEDDETSELYKEFYRVRNVQRVINYTSLSIIGAGVILSDRSDDLSGAIIGLGTIGIGAATMLFGNLITIPIKARKKRKIIVEVGEFDKNYKRRRDLSLNLNAGAYGIGLVLNF